MGGTALTNLLSSGEYQQRDVLPLNFPVLRLLAVFDIHSNLVFFFNIPYRLKEVKPPAPDTET